jgi:hypothetical protein
MKSLKFLTYLIISGSLLFSLSSCEDSSTSIDDGDNDNGEVTNTQYAIAASSGENSYLLQTASVDTGSISAQSDEAIQVLGNRSWFFFKDIAAYSFLYAQGDPGTVSSYILDQEGQLDQRQELGLEVSIQSRGIYKDNLVVQYSSRSYEDPVATFYKVNGVTEAISDEIVVQTDTLAPEGEIAYFTDIAQYGDYILASFRTISGGADEELGTFGSEHLNETFIAVYDENFNPVKVIHDEGQTGQIAGQTRSQGRTGIEEVDSGDVYAFSSAIEAPDVPSGVLKINEGELEFDQDYFFDISAASGGYDVYRTYYMGGSTFVVRMYDDQASASPSVSKTGFAVVDVVEQTFSWIEDGIPSEISAISAPYIDRDNNQLIYGITTPDTRPHLYSIDPETATMTQGTEVVAESILGIGKLTIQ